MRAKKIIWVGLGLFGSKLVELGHEWHFVPYAQGRVFGWADLVRESGVSDPDLVVVTDHSAPPFVLGVESFPCLTAFYAIDTHIHSWYPYYAQAFDLALVSLADHRGLFCGKGMRLSPESVLWSPVYQRDQLTERETASLADKKWDLLFVGKADPAINPARVEFLKQVARAFPGLHCQSGDWRELFPRARLVLNHTIAHDLNFRVVEALASGSCLLTPRIGHGLGEMFEDGRELFLYEQDDISGLTALVERLLENPALRAETAARGLEKVNAGHLGIHRAKSFSEAFSGLFASGHAREMVCDRLAAAGAIHEKYLKYLYLLHAESLEMPTLREAYLAAARKNV